MNLFRASVYALLSLSIGSQPLFAGVSTPVAPPGIKASSAYAIAVVQDGKTNVAHVFQSFPQERYNRSKSASWANFEFTGRVSVRVTKLNGAWSNCVVLPSSYDIAVRREGEAAVFELDRPRKVAVEFDRSIAHPLMVFADAPETDAPKPGDTNVVYFGPGLHDIGGNFQIQAGQTIYLAPGAYVKGRLVANDAPNITVRGHGILDGRDLPHRSGHLINFRGNCDDALIEGVTLIDAPQFFVVANGRRSVIRNIKTSGWWFNTDGVSTGEDGLVEDCFLRCNDDAVKVYRSGMRVRNCAIWQMENGSPFQLTWNMGSDNHGFNVSDCDVFRVDHAWDNPNEAVFDSIHGGRGNMSGFVFENIRIENCDWRLVSLQVVSNQFAKSKTLGTISNVVFRNITLDTPDGKPLKRLNVLQGADRSNQISGITFENVRVNGKPLRDAEQGRFAIDPATVSAVKFVVNGAPVSDPAQRLNENTQHAGPEAGAPFTCRNPISEGLNSHGIRDCQVFREGGRWYLVGTEVPNPEWGKRGVVLYGSDDLLRWQEEAFLIHRPRLPKDVWYRDRWWAPEIHRIGGRFYLLFNCRNETSDQPHPHGCGVAVAGELKGPYRVLTENEPFASGNDLTFFEDKDGKVFAFWNGEQRMFAAEVDMARMKPKGEPRIIFRPDTNTWDQVGVEAPWCIKRGGTYYLFYSSWSRGYEVGCATAKHPLGPWTKFPGNPIYGGQSKATCEKNGLPYTGDPASPFVAAGHNQTFTGPDGRLWLSCHAIAGPQEMLRSIKSAGLSDDGVENRDRALRSGDAFLCIDPIEFDADGNIRAMKPTWRAQTVLTR